MTGVLELEGRLCELTDRQHVLATGRGATALWLALECLVEHCPGRKTVILPATLCTSPPTVCQLSGLETVFCDVDPLSGQMDVAHLAQLLNEHSDVLTVLAVHLYGQPCDIKQIEALCRNHEVYLIEDAAQAWGLTIEDRPAGSWGDVSILSFGHTKILDAGGGGAVGTNDSAFAQSLRDKIVSLPAPPDQLGQWAQDYRQAYYTLASRFEDPHIRRGVGALCGQHPQRYRYRLMPEQANPILKAIDTQSASIERRQEMSQLWDDALPADVIRMKTDPKGVPWRFNLQLPHEGRDRLIETLRNQSVDVSCWYPNVATFFSTQPELNLPGADQLEATILNLWTDHTITAEKITQAARLINEVLDQTGLTHAIEVR